MKLAVTYENGMVYGHFGHTENFKIYDIEDKTVKSVEIVPTNGSGHGALADFLADNGVATLICGGIGSGAKNALAEKNIMVYGGVSGNADEAVKAFLNNTLQFDLGITCTHHDHEHHGDCASGGCGGNCGH